jgi:hypothetical protein
MQEEASAAQRRAAEYALYRVGVALEWAAALYEELARASFPEAAAWWVELRAFQSRCAEMIAELEARRDATEDEAGGSSPPDGE